MKGQVEFFVILGIIFIIVAVVFYGYFGGFSSVPTAVSQQQAVISASFEDFIRNGALNTISMVGSNGGYLECGGYSLGSVVYTDKEIPYWQYFGQTAYPDMPANMQTGIENYIEDNKDAFFDSVTGKELVVGDVSDVAVTMTDNSMRIDLYMPLSIVFDDVQYAFAQPFTVEVPTNMGQIYNFAKDFTAMEASNRYFEVFTLTSMVLSPLDAEPPGGVNEIPTVIALNDCGQVVLRTWFDVQPNMARILGEVVANTYMPNKSPQDNFDSSTTPEYEIPTLNGKYYSDLEVGFDLPDDFELNQMNFQMNPNPIYAYAKPVPLTGICLSDPIEVNYFLTYPLVISVRDSLTGASFDFANTVYINDNTAGAWTTSADGYDSTELQEICADAGCSFNILVQDSVGNPLSGASVKYLDCSIGKTNENGMLDTWAPCGIGDLEIYKHGYGTYDQIRASSDLDGTTIQLVRIPVKQVHLYEVNVRNETTLDQYRINVNEVGPIGTDYNGYYYHGDEIANLKFYTSPVDYYTAIFDSISGQLSYVPAGSYSVAGSLVNSDYTTNYGTFFTSFEMSEDDGDLYVYLPYTLGFNNIEGTEAQLFAIGELSSLLSKCGLGPVSETPVHESFEGCIKSYGEL